MHINVEFKARHRNLAGAETILLQQAPLFVGEDHQIDTYFNANTGRLKLREGNIEHALIFYQRTNEAAAKQSNVILYNKPGEELKQILTQSLGIKTVVDKRRRIYFIDNVKFHFDTVAGLGQFVEVEAIDKDGSTGTEKLKVQCSFYQTLFGIADKDFIADSYSDMLLAKKSSLL